MVAPLSISLLCLFATFGGAQIHQGLIYDRDAIMKGQVWRLITGNLTQFGFGHWMMNILGLWLIWLLYRDYLKSNAIVFLVILTSGLGTCTGLLIFNPHLHNYVGLSGALHGLFTAAIVFSFRQEPRMQTIMSILLCAKLTYEQFFGSLPGSEQTAGVPVIVDSHLYGAITGIVTGFAINVYTKLTARGSSMSPPKEE